MDWDDLRYFIALARAGSLSAAARRLRAEHSTVARRIAGLEAALGLRLFDRLPRGYALTPEGEQVAELAERLEEDVHAIERLVRGQEGASPAACGSARRRSSPASSWRPAWRRYGPGILACCWNWSGRARPPA